MWVYREVKQEVSFEENFDTYMDSLLNYFLKFCSGINELFEELGRHTKRGGSQECLNCGACDESVEHVVFECASYNSQR